MHGEKTIIHQDGCRFICTVRARSDSKDKRMKHRAIRMGICCMLSMMTILSCGLSDEEFKRLAKEEYDRKVSMLSQEKRNLCYREALIIAEQMADSIIRDMNLNPLQDTLYRPAKPERPSFIKTDTTILISKETVKPIINSTPDRG
jgi:hypothetical protein